MGLFLAVAGVAGSTIEQVGEILDQFAQNRNLQFGPASVPVDEREVLYMAQSEFGNASIRFPHEFYEWDEASEYLSSKLKTPVFSFHIHDGDLWMYRLFNAGEEVDQFNPIPEYWEELPAAERDRWKGNASTVASIWPNVTRDAIERYLVTWDVVSTESKKAYPDDEFPIGTDWQLVDFMRKIGLQYPDDNKAMSNAYLLRHAIKGTANEPKPKP